MRRRLSGDKFLAIALGVIAFCVYLRTLAPGCTAGDGPELATAMYQLGVAHPTGYPLYTILGHFFMKLLPFGTPIWKANLLSAVSAAVAVAFAFLLIRQICRRAFPAVIATLLFAFGLTFWSQAVVTEVYAFHLLLVGAILYSILKWDRTGNRRWLYGAALFVGLAFTHHLTSIFLLPGLLFYVLTSKHRMMFWKEFLKLAGIVAGCLLIYFYLPYAANSGVRENWGDPHNWHNFVRHISGGQYQNYMTGQTKGALWQQVVDYFGLPIHDVRPGFLISEFALSVLWLAPIGLWHLFRRQRRTFGLTALIFLFTVGWTLVYNIPDREAYYQVSYLMVTTWIAFGLRSVSFYVRRLARKFIRRRADRKRTLAFAGTLALLVPLFAAAGNWEANNRRGDRTYHELAWATIDYFKPNATVFTMGDNLSFPLLYVRYVEGRRPDVTVILVPEILQPNLVRNIERLQSPSLVVRVSDIYRRKVGTDVTSFHLLRDILKDNVNRVPLYLHALSEEILKLSTITYEVVPGYKKVGPSTLPLLEVTDRPHPDQKAFEEHVREGAEHNH